MSTRGVAILGSTGSIGTTALRVLARQRDRFHVAALTAFSNAGLLAEQAAQFEPEYVGLVRNGGESVHPAWGRGDACLIEAATHDRARPDADRRVLTAGHGVTGGMTNRPCTTKRRRSRAGSHRASCARHNEAR